jgi:hypothetical protein
MEADGCAIYHRTDRSWRFADSAQLWLHPLCGDYRRRHSAKSLIGRRKQERFVLRKIRQGRKGCPGEARAKSEGSNDRPTAKRNLRKKILLLSSPVSIFFIVVEVKSRF